MPENSSRAVLITSWVWTTRSRLLRNRCEDTKIRNADAISRTAVGAIISADGRVFAAKSTGSCAGRLSRFRDRAPGGARGKLPHRMLEVRGDLVEEAFGGQPLL